MIVDVAIFFAIVLLVLVLGTLMFAAWLGISIVRLLGRMVGATFRAAFGSGGGWGGKTLILRQCTRPACGQMNPREANFCRRCGRAIVYAGPEVRVVEGGVRPNLRDGVRMGSRG